MAFIRCLWEIKFWLIIINSDQGQTVINEPPNHNKNYYLNND
jgi:hypothetical protein